MKIKIISLFMIILIVFSYSTCSFAENNTLTEIEVLPGVHVNINLSEKNGITELNFTDGTIKQVNYELVLRPKGEFLKITFDSSVMSENEILLRTSSSGSYYIDEVIRVYSYGSNAPTSIFHTENGPHGYAEGSLSLYCFGTYVEGDATYEAWYRGWMVYGNITPTSIDISK